MREIIVDTDQNYQFSSGRLYPIIIYEYFGDGKVKKLHEGYIDSCIGYLCGTKEVSVIWIDYREFLANELDFYLLKSGINASVNYAAYNYIKESRFRKRFISYWIETSPEKYGDECNDKQSST